MAWNAGNGKKQWTKTKSDEPCAKIWKKKVRFFHPSNAQKGRQLEKTLMFEKAKVLSMLEDTGIAWFSKKQQLWKHPWLWSLQVLLEGE